MEKVSFAATEVDLFPFPHQKHESHTWIGGRFRVLSFLGRGGMGDVFRVFDEVLEEEIALKMLRLSSDDSPEILRRFKSEVKLSRKISHPNIARVFDLGEDDGRYYLTMEYVEGHTLSRWLKMRESLSLERIFSIARQLCEGLEAAHRAKIAHRDIKPGNIMLTPEGRVVLTDFGIAQLLLPAEKNQGGETNIVGTVAYMAPEQLGGGLADHRADIYAVGVVLYELISGRRLWKGNNAAHLIFRRLSEEPPPLKTFLSYIPTTLSDLVERCMARDPGDRYTSLSEVLDVLRILPISVDLSGHLVERSMDSKVGTLFLASKAKPMFEAQGRKRIAVLPFEGCELLGEWGEVWFREWSEILSMTGALEICEQGLVEEKYNSSLDSRALGQLLQVDAVINGRVEILPDQTKQMTLCLSTVQDGFLLWTRQVRGENSDFFSVMEQWVQEVSSSLSIRHQKGIYLSTNDPIAIELYSRGRRLLRQHWYTDLSECLETFRESLARAPSDPLILSFAALAYARNAFFRGRQEMENAGIAWDLSARALEKAPSRGESFLARAILLLAEGKWVETIQSLQEAVIRAPLLAEAYEMMGRILLECGPLDAAIAWLERASSMDAGLLHVRWELIRAYALAERWEEADSLAAMEIDEKGLLFRAYQRTRTDLWRPSPRWLHQQDMEELQPARGIEQVLYLLIGCKRELLRGLPLSDLHLRVIEEHFEKTKSHPVLGVTNRRALAELEFYVGRVDAAFDALEQATSLGLRDLVWLEHCPLLASHRQDPRFQKVREKVLENIGGVEALWSQWQKDEAEHCGA